jgi:hypothetical protein
LYATTKSRNERGVTITMKELLIDQLKQYLEEKEALMKKIVELMEKGEPYEEEAKKAAGKRIMIEAVIYELKKYE